MLQVAKNLFTHLGEYSLMARQPKDIIEHAVDVARLKGTVTCVPDLLSLACPKSTLPTDIPYFLKPVTVLEMLTILENRRKEEVEIELEVKPGTSKDGVNVGKENVKRNDKDEENESKAKRRRVEILDVQPGTSKQGVGTEKEIDIKMEERKDEDMETEGDGASVVAQCDSSESVPALSQISSGTLNTAFLADSTTSLVSHSSAESTGFVYNPGGAGSKAERDAGNVPLSESVLTQDSGYHTVSSSTFMSHTSLNQSQKLETIPDTETDDQNVSVNLM